MKSRLIIDLPFPTDIYFGNKIDRHLYRYQTCRFIKMMHDIPNGAVYEIGDLFEVRYAQARELRIQGMEIEKAARLAAERHARRPIVRLKKFLDSLRLHHLN
jgi:hypothetical protein